jgi:pyridoxamine 5'-phosphate oxidase family protein
MSVFTNDELAYLLGERRLAGIATIGKDGTPHVPVGWSYNSGEGTIDIGGLDLGRG